MESRPEPQPAVQARTTLYLRGVPRDLIREAKAFAARRGVTMTALVVEALADRIGQPRRGAEGLPDRLRADAAWYERHRAELAERYPDRYLAIVDGQIVDHDEDFEALAGRVFITQGAQPVFMPRVSPHERVVRVPSPRVARR